MVDRLFLLILTLLVIAVEFVPLLFLEWISLFASNLQNSQFSAICRCQNHFLTLSGRNQRPRLWQQSPLRENENIHEKPQLHEIWLVWSILFLYALWTWRNKSIFDPVGRAFFIPVLQVRARALLSRGTPLPVRGTSEVRIT